MTPPPVRSLLSLRMRWKRWLRDAGIVLLILIGIQAWQTRSVPRGPAPDFTAAMSDGSISQFATWRATQGGRATGLYFWAEWCPVCKAQQGNVQAVRADWPVLTVAMQSGDAIAVARYLQQQGLDWPTAIDAKGHIAAQHGLGAVPAFVVIDGEGRISSVSVGYTTAVGMRLRLWWAAMR